MELFFYFPIGCLIVGVIFIIRGFFSVSDPFKAKKQIFIGALILLLPLVILVFYIAIQNSLVRK